MVLSVAKFVPAGLHVYQTLDGKINIKTQQFILYIYTFVGSSVIFYSRPVFPPTYYFLKNKFIVDSITNISNFLPFSSPSSQPISPFPQVFIILLPVSMDYVYKYVNSLVYLFSSLHSHIEVNYVIYPIYNVSNLYNM